MPNSATEEAPSLSAMSLQDTGTDQMVLASREGEAVVPLTERSLAMLGSDDSIGVICQVHGRNGIVLQHHLPTAHP